MKNKFKKDPITSEEGFEKGLVKERLDSDLVKIILESKEACDHCHAKVICQPNESGKREVILSNDLDAKEGDIVLLESSDLSHIKVTAMQYGLPLLGFLLGLFISHSIIQTTYWGLPSELIDFFAGILGLSGASCITYFWSKRKSQNNFSVLKMKSILQDEK